jgi:hypothetical protein
MYLKEGGDFFSFSRLVIDSLPSEGVPPKEAGLCDEEAMVLLLCVCLWVTVWLWLFGEEEDWRVELANQAFITFQDPRKIQAAMGIHLSLNFSERELHGSPSRKLGKTEK